MQLNHTTVRAGAVAFTLLAPVAANASPFATPDLAPGQGFRVAFVSEGTAFGPSTDIGTYNSFVTAQAAQNTTIPAASWSAIVSTATVNAVDNVNCSGCNDVPIYMVDGTRLADSTTALFANGPLTAFDKTQFGDDSFTDYAWSGSNSSGTAKTQDGASETMGTSAINVGEPNSTGNWLDKSIHYPSGARFPVYALSSEFFVPGGTTAVPEPASLVLLGTAGLLAMGARRRARRTDAN